MSDKRLSRTQQELVNHLRDHATYLHFMPYAGRFNPRAYYFAHETMKRFRVASVEKLLALNVLEIYGRDHAGHKVRLRALAAKESCTP